VEPRTDTVTVKVPAVPPAVRAVAVARPRESLSTVAVPVPLAKVADAVPGTTVNVVGVPRNRSPEPSSTRVLKWLANVPLTGTDWLLVDPVRMASVGVPIEKEALVTGVESAVVDTVAEY